LGRIEEGISFKRVSQVHLCNPWWNQSRMEQIIGRGIRYLSHATLPESKRFVDVYYHCSVLPTYPMVDKTILKQFPRGENYMDMARTSVDQTILSTARRKNNLNNQFDLVAKETAVDYELNYYGNVTKLEEFQFPEKHSVKVPKGHVIMYNRLVNKYYLYSKTSKELIEIEMKYRERDYVAFPAYDFKELKTKTKPFKTETTKDSLERPMISIIMLEDIKSFNKDKRTNDKTFHELKRYAIKEKGEDKEAWELADQLRLNNEAIEMLIATFGLESARGTKELQGCLIDNFLDGPIEVSSKKQLVIARKDKKHIEELVMTTQAQEQKKLLVDNLMNTKYKSMGSEKLNEYSIYQLRNMWKLIEVPDKKGTKKVYQKKKKSKEK
jgi:hypothetical protein